VPHAPGWSRTQIVARRKCAILNCTTTASWRRSDVAVIHFQAGDCEPPPKSEPSSARPGPSVRERAGDRVIGRSAN